MESDDLATNRWVPQVSLLRPGIRATELQWKLRPPFVIPTRISCHAALDEAAYAPFRKRKAHEVRQRHQPPEEIRGSGAEGPAFHCTPNKVV
jgi:hypothetical protein